VVKYSCDRPYSFAYGSQRSALPGPGTEGASVRRRGQDAALAAGRRRAVRRRPQSTSHGCIRREERLEAREQPPRALFTLSTTSSYEPSPEGQRFLVTAVVSDASPITVILNWKPPSRCEASHSRGHGGGAVCHWPQPGIRHGLTRRPPARTRTPIRQSVMASVWGTGSTLFVRGTVQDPRADRVQGCRTPASTRARRSAVPISSRCQVSAAACRADNAASDPRQRLCRAERRDALHGDHEQQSISPQFPGVLLLQGAEHNRTRVRVTSVKRVFRPTVSNRTVSKSIVQSPRLKRFHDVEVDI
jgi:hypothetical protein